MSPRNLYLGIALLVAALSASAAIFTNHIRPAHFRISSEVVTESVEPFTATVGTFGNNLIWSGGAFEPVVFRNRYTATEDSENRVVIAPEALSKYDSLREGFLEGADVRIYRIVNGKMQMVRRDTVANGGARMSGWVPILRARQLIPADQPTYTFRWAQWNRPRVPYYFTVRAVDTRGRLSAIANTIEVVWQGGTSASEPVNRLINTGTNLSPDPANLPPPNNLRFRFIDDSTIQLEWDSANSTDLAGYAVYRSDYPPTKHSGHFIELNQIDKKNTIKSGDMIIVSKMLLTASRSASLSNRVWGANAELRQILPGLVHFFPDESREKTWELAKHSADTAVDHPGSTYLKLTLARGSSETISIPNHSGTGQSRYEVLRQQPYQVEVWLRQEGTGTVQFTVSGFYGRGPNEIKPIVFKPSTEWKKFTATFNPTSLNTGRQVGHMALEFTGPGTFSIDNFRVYRADADYLDFPPEELQAIRSSAMGALRTHGAIKTGTRTYDMSQFTNPPGVIEGIRQGNTLPQMLGAFRKAGVRPWLQIEYHMAPEEWLGLIEYLAAPYSINDTAKSKPWASKRHKQGHPEPWASDFDKIYLELSNETWNRLFQPWIFEPMRDAANGRAYTAGEVYGLFQEHVISILKSSPYWNQAGLDKKLVFVLGGWAARPQFGRDAASASPSSDLLTVGAYIGGWDEAEGPPRLDAKNLYSVLNHVNQSGIPVAEEMRSIAQAIKPLRKRPVALGTYEAGPGYALNGLNNAKVTEEESAEQELVMKSIAAGTATLDAFLARALRGFSVQNFFTFGAGAYWKSHAHWHKGGNAYPSWELLSTFNKHATGNMLRVDTLSAPTSDLDGFGRRKPIRNAPLVNAYATRSKDRYSVIVVSRKVPGFPTPVDQGFTPVTIDLPFNSAESLTLFRLIGQPESSILKGDDVRVEKVSLETQKPGRRLSIDATTGADQRGLPPGSTYIYIFEGVKTHEK